MADADGEILTLDGVAAYLKAGKIVEVGEALPMGQHASSVLPRKGLIAVWPMVEHTAVYETNAALQPATLKRVFAGDA